jgi:hypothetical protein
MTNDLQAEVANVRHSTFGLVSSFWFRHSSLVHTYFTNLSKVLLIC